MSPYPLPEKTGVLVIGAGPTGLSLAIALQQAGVDYVLIDKLMEGQNTSRAAVIHAHTLEVLEHLGVVDELERRGLKLACFSIRDRRRALLRLRFDSLPSSHPYLLMLPQDVTEKVLTARLQALGGVIYRGVSAGAVAQGSEGVTVTVQTAAGECAIRCRYAVGADGMHSIVRSSAGIGFEGGAYEDSFVLADVRMEWSLGNSQVSLFFSPGGLVVVAPLPDGAFRIVATCDNAPEHPAAADIQDLLDARGPERGTNRVQEVVWSSRFRIHHRVATSYRSGRLFVMGDAAHVHSPAGGQGMNTGLVDAVVLGQLLTRVMKGERPDFTLDEYQAIRRPAAAQVLSLAGRLTALATMRGTWKLAIRNLVLSLVGAIPPARRRLELNLSGLSRRGLALVSR